MKPQCSNCGSVALITYMTTTYCHNCDKTVEPEPMSKEQEDEILWNDHIERMIEEAMESLRPWGCFDSSRYKEIL